MNEIAKEYGDRVRSDVCHKCGGPAPHWKCPKCSEESEFFDPNHWRMCRHGTKMQAKCEACGQAEDNCTCESVTA